MMRLRHFNHSQTPELPHRLRCCRRSKDEPKQSRQCVCCPLSRCTSEPLAFRWRASWASRGRAFSVAR
eukprot:4146643-Pyramimonas_sp.AAC.1